VAQTLRATGTLYIAYVVINLLNNWYYSKIRRFCAGKVRFVRGEMILLCGRNRGGFAARLRQNQIRDI